MKKNSPGTTLLMLALTLLILGYFGMQAFRYFMDPFSTTLAYSYQVEEEVSLSGWVVRTEQLLPDSGEGLLRLQREEGERVSAGGVVAQVYSDQSALDVQAEIAALTTQLEQLRYAQEAALGAEAALKLDAQIKQSILDYRSHLAGGHLSRAEMEGAQLRALVLKRDYTFSAGQDFTPRIEELESQIKSLSKQASGSVRRITAPRSGMYSSVVDGYETVLQPHRLAALTPSELSALQPDSAAASNVGKLILNDDWYYVAVLPADQAEALAEQGGMLLRFAKSVERDLEVTVASVGPEENGKAVVAFHGNTYLPLLTLLRRQSAQVVTETVSGIRVPKEALRIATKTVTEEDGTQREVQVTGVYCMVGKEARFKPVEILYSGEGFALVKSTVSTDQNILWLRPGDEVVISARDLYDGKVLNEN